MEIKRNGFMYRCAYGFMDEDRHPQTVNPYSFFCKFLWMFCFGWIILYAIWAIAVAVIAVFGFFFAARPTILTGEEDVPTPAIHYTHWPRIRGKRIWPIWFVLGGLAIWLIYAHGAAATTATIDLAAGLTEPMFWRCFTGTAICFVVALLTYRFFRSEIWRIFRAWCRARKEKVCPIIKVVD